MEALYTFEQLHYKHVLHIPSLVLPRGGVTTLFGPSGCGKTSLLRLLNKMASPTEGRLLYKGLPADTLDSVALRREVSLLSQTPVLFEGSVRDNLLAGLRYQGRAMPDEEILAETLRRVRLPVALDASVANLSGGEKQRLALGRVLLLNAPVYLLDEPSAALDSETAGAIVAMMAGLVQKEGATLIMVTHSQKLAETHSSRIIHLQAGRVDKQEELA